MIAIRPELNAEERELLSAAYKGAMMGLRTAWRSLCSIEERTSEDMTVEQRQVASLLLKSDKILFTYFLFSQIAENYREQIEEALVAICREILVRQFGVQLIHSIIFFLALL